jgi:hypothetical protein
MKISETQRSVLINVKNGYEIGFYNGYQPTVALQYGGCGRGGKSLDFKMNSFNALLIKGLIERNAETSAWNLTRYKLTELGIKTANEPIK